MEGKRRIGFVGLLSFFLAGCDLGEPIQLGPAQPALVTVLGEAKLPKDYPVNEVQAIRLYTLEGRLIACGSLLDETGAYSLSVAPANLHDTTGLFQLALKDGATIVYSAPLRLSKDSPERRQNIDAATTALWLAAKESAGKGQNPLQWNFDRLLTEQSVKDAATKIEGEVVEWSRDRQGAPFTTSIQGSIERILAVASKI
ncbi:MAG: hypothetical protein ACM3YO_03020 [Bacteroidota bacterium]